jgi:cytochrome c556
MCKLLLGAAAVICLAGIVPVREVRAQQPAPTTPQDLIVVRQAGYDLQQGVANSMKAAVASGADVKQFADAAKAIAAWGGAMPFLFPPGSETGHGTKAKPEIWTDRAGFLADSAKLTEAADKLAALADADDKAGFAAQFQTMAGTCGACHKAYRNR